MRPARGYFRPLSFVFNLILSLLLLPYAAFVYFAECLHVIVQNSRHHQMGSCESMSPLPRRLKSPRRRLPRPTILLLTLFSILWWFSYRQFTWIQSTHTPILGAKPSSLFLYFPPIGRDFLPKVPAHNVYRHTHPRTPLLIPFTRNNTMLQQAVLSYIASGWPRNDIVIVDNTGAMDSNYRRVLPQDDPFFLDYDLFRRRYGVAILQTPTLLNFAQLQNFMLRTAIARNWQFYFWSHMDVAVLSGEDVAPFKSFYHRIIDVLDASGLDQYSTLPPDSSPEAESSNGNRLTLSGLKLRKPKNLKWAIKFFDFDNLALINVAAWRSIGSWDVFIPYYNTDCDAYARIVQHGFTKETAQAGYMFDVAGVVEDPENRFFPAKKEKDRRKWGLAPEGPEPSGGELNSMRFQWLKAELQDMMDSKNSNELGRNTWQGAASAGTTREPRNPWSYESKAFQAAWWAAADHGRAIYIKKWGTLECELTNKTTKDAWLQEYLVEGSEEWRTRVEAENHWNDVLNEGAIR